MVAAITSEMADIVRSRAWNASRRQSRKPFSLSLTGDRWFGVPVRSLRVPSHVPSHPQMAAKLRALSLTASGFTAETDWPLEGAGFEPSVPLYGELGALGRVRRTRAAIVKPGTPDRSRRRARRAICGTPGDGQSRALDRLRRLRAFSGVSVRLLGKVRDLSGRSGLSAGKGPNRDESGIP